MNADMNDLKEMLRQKRATIVLLTSGSHESEFSRTWYAARLDMIDEMIDMIAALAREGGK